MSEFSSFFEIKDVDLAGRIGRLRIRGKSLETPAFFPVINVLKQEVSIEEIEKAGFKQLIVNAYILKKRYGDLVIQKGVHSFLGFDGVVMTDSGAYQILEYGDIEFEQKEIIDYEKAIGSDIAVILDIPTGDVDYETAKKTVEETLRRGREAEAMIEGSDQVWLMPVQGGRYLDLVEMSAREAASMKGYSMYGIGSPTVFLERYDFDVILDMIYTAKRRLPEGKPVHLFGAGHPLILPFAIALGIDTFDSASYILYARDERYMLESGVYDLKELDYLPCNCSVCSSKSVEDLKTAEASEKTRLLALHNLYVIKKSIEKTKQAIREGRLWEYLVELSASHPKAYECLLKMRRYMKYLEERTPEAEGRIKALRFSRLESVWNPKVIRYYKRIASVLDGLLKKAEKLILRPFLDETECLLDYDFERRDQAIVIYYRPYLGLIPEKLCGTYPTTQSVFSGLQDSRVVDLLANSVRALASKAKKEGVQVVVEYCNRVYWQRAVGVEARELGLEVVERC
ncbi:MAG: tRNA guanosine(15) transglycosylase TgtA [Acidilobaceae archaeon]